MAAAIGNRAALRIASALLGSTMLSGVPVGVAAQEAPAQPAPDTSILPQVETVRTISVSGAQRFEPDTILSYIRLRPGDQYTPEAADQVLKDLAATELFSDYSIRDSGGGNIVIEVAENPIVNRIVLEGNERLDNDKITPEIKLAPRQIFTPSKVRADVARILELYKREGRYAATIEPQMVMLDQNRVDVIFEISEGPKSKVRQINVIGNEAFSDSKLRGEMYTKRAGGLLSFLSSNTSYDPDRLAADQQQLRAFYLTEGYAEFRVVSAVAELTPDRRDFIITYVVEEGERYKFGDINVDSQLREFNADVLESQLAIQKGDWYNAKTVEDIAEALAESAGTLGYAFADVRPRFNRNAEDRTMDITFVIREAPRTYVERIDVNGNTLTQDKVVRREFRIAEGDAFNSLQVKRSTNRINSLGYFQENFEVEQKDGSAPDRIILEANVEEKATGEIQLSAGFSSIESFIFNGSIRQRNFRGRGQTIGASVNYSRYSRGVNLSFTEPYLFDKNISLGADVFHRELNSFNRFQRERNNSFEQRQTGFNIRAGLPLTEYIYGLARYTLQYEEVSLDENLFFADFDGDGIDTCEPLLPGSSRFLCEAVGQRWSSILGGTLSFDNTDSRFRPTRGERVQINADIAGLGGDVKYVKLRSNAAKYWELFDDFIFSLSLEGGTIRGFGEDRGPGVDPVRLTDRFFLGEPQMRGFDIRGVGPRVLRRPIVDLDGDGVGEVITDRDQSFDTPIGGNAYYLGRAELEIPLGSGARELGLRPSIFLDVGSLFNITRPNLSQSPFPNGIFVATRDADGNALFSQIDTRDEAGNPTSTSVVTNPVGPDGTSNIPIGSSIPPFEEVFLGDSPEPRIAVGVGVNWNSPFGPFRIDFSQVIRSQEGDDEKTLSFNVGTQF